MSHLEILNLSCCLLKSVLLLFISSVLYHKFITPVWQVQALLLPIWRTYHRIWKTSRIWSCARSGDWQQRYKAWILGRGIYNFKLDSAHIQGQTPEEQVLRYNYWWSVWNLKQVHYCQNLSGYRRWGSCSDICDGSPRKMGAALARLTVVALVSVLLKVKSHLSPHLV